MIFNEYEFAVIEQICKNSKTSMPFIRNSGNRDFQTIAARNGIISFLYDQGWHEVEIAQNLRQELGYVMTVVKSYKEQRMARQVAALKQKPVDK